MDQKLFNIHVPWYVRVWGSFKAWRRNRKVVAAAKAEKARYRHIATVKQVTNWSDTGGTAYEYYVLWKNGHGQTRYDYRSDHYLLNKPMQTKVYNHVVEPWLNGRIGDDYVQNLEKKQFAS